MSLIPWSGGATILLCRCTGDVEIRDVMQRGSGPVASLVTVSGMPVLAQAISDSLKQPVRNAQHGLYI